MKAGLTFGGWLKRRRGGLALTQKELAQQVGYAEVTLLNLQRIELEVYTDNEPAVRLYRKFGFVVEGTLVRYAFRAGEFVDVYAMARLRERQGQVNP